jgi:uncharacterized protein YuzE
VSKSNEESIGFEISTSGDEDGEVESAYIYLSHNPVARSRTHKAEVLMADYDAAGEIVGIEIIAPVRISGLVELADPDQREAFERFIRGAAPPALIQN